MARCSRCNKFMIFSSTTGYCKDCVIAIVKEEEMRRENEERKKQEEEARRRVEEEQCQDIEECIVFKEENRILSEEEQKNKACTEKAIIEQYYNNEISQGNILQFLQAGVLNVNSIWMTKDAKRSLLSIAIDKEDHDLAMYLVNNGCNTNLETYDCSSEDSENAVKFSDTPLSLAIHYEDYVLADLLIFHGADISFRRQMGVMRISIISLIAAMGNSHQLKWLLENGANPNQESIVMGGTKTVPLYDAISKRNYENASLLIKAGANPNYIIRAEAADYTALNYAIMNNDYTAFNILLDAKADPNCIRVSHIGGGVNPALCDAVSEKKYEMVERLILAGADKQSFVTLKGRKISLKELAMLNNDYPMITLLREHGIY